MLFANPAHNVLNKKKIFGIKLQRILVIEYAKSKGKKVRFLE